MKYLNLSPKAHRIFLYRNKEVTPPKKASGKPREDYLIKYEENLLKKLSENYGAINKYLAYCFLLSVVFILFTEKILKELKFEGYVLTLTEKQSLIVFSFLIFVPYFLINNSVLKISAIVSLLKTNSEQISALNKDARPFEVGDLNFLTDGIAGLQLQFSKWIATKFLKNSVINFHVDIPEKKDISTVTKFTGSLLLRLVSAPQNMFSFVFYKSIWLIFLVFIYLLPLAAVIYKFYITTIHLMFATPLPWQEYFNLNMLLFATMIFMVLYTTIANLKLYTFYFNELNELKKNKDFAYIAKDFTDNYNKIRNFYLPFFAKKK